MCMLGEKFRGMTYLPGVCPDGIAKLSVEKYLGNIGDFFWFFRLKSLNDISNWEKCSCIHLFIICLQLHGARTIRMNKSQLSKNKFNKKKILYIYKFSFLFAYSHDFWGECFFLLLRKWRTNKKDFCCHYHKWLKIQSAAPIRYINSYSFAIQLMNKQHSSIQYIHYSD